MNWWKIYTSSLRGCDEKCWVCGKDIRDDSRYCYSCVSKTGIEERKPAKLPITTIKVQGEQA